MELTDKTPIDLNVTPERSSPNEEDILVKDISTAIREPFSIQIPLFEEVGKQLDEPEIASRLVRALSLGQIEDQLPFIEHGHRVVLYVRHPDNGVAPEQVNFLKHVFETAEDVYQVNSGPAIPGGERSLLLEQNLANELFPDEKSKEFSELYTVLQDSTLMDSRARQIFLEEVTPDSVTEGFVVATIVAPQRMWNEFVVTFRLDSGEEIETDMVNIKLCGIIGIDRETYEKPYLYPSLHDPCRVWFDGSWRVGQIYEFVAHNNVIVRCDEPVHGYTEQLDGKGLLIGLSSYDMDLRSLDEYPEPKYHPMETLPGIGTRKVVQIHREDGEEEFGVIHGWDTRREEIRILTTRRKLYISFEEMRQRLGETITVFSMSGSEMRRHPEYRQRCYFSVSTVYGDGTYELRGVDEDRNLWIGEQAVFSKHDVPMIVAVGIENARRISETDANLMEIEYHIKLSQIRETSEEIAEDNDEWETLQQFLEDSRRLYGTKMGMIKEYALLLNSDVSKQEWEASLPSIRYAFDKAIQRGTAYWKRTLEQSQNVADQRKMYTAMWEISALGARARLTEPVSEAIVRSVERALYFGESTVSPKGLEFQHNYRLGIPIAQILASETVEELENLQIQMGERKSKRRRK